MFKFLIRIVNYNLYIKIKITSFDYHTKLVFSKKAKVINVNQRFHKCSVKKS